MASWLPRFKHDAAVLHTRRTSSGSVYSNYLSGGAPQQPYEHLSAAVDAVAARIKHAAAPTYTYLYVPFIDAAEHDHGPYSKPVAKTLDDGRSAASRRLAAQLAGRARIVVSADHGLTHVDRQRSGRNQGRRSAARPAAAAAVRRAARAARSTCATAAANASSSCSTSGFGDTHALLTIDEVDELRLLGPEPLAPETRRRMGDFMAISATPDAINYKPDEPMLGYHGGLLPDEMRIPLIVA